jgi:hypothetical protein
MKITHIICTRNRMEQLSVQDDDWRIANATISRLVTVQPSTVLPTGTLQGVNIIFLREVFEKAGKFREDMGSGMPYAGQTSAEMPSPKRAQGAKA